MFINQYPFSQILHWKHKLRPKINTVIKYSNINNCVKAWVSGISYFLILHCCNLWNNIKHELLRIALFSCTWIILWLMHDWWNKESEAKMFDNRWIMHSSISIGCKWMNNNCNIKLIEFQIYFSIFFCFKNAENKKNEKKVFQLANYGTFFGLWPNELWDI